MDLNLTESGPWKHVLSVSFSVLLLLVVTHFLCPGFRKANEREAGSKRSDVFALQKKKKKRRGEGEAFTVKERGQGVDIVWTEKQKRRVKSSKKGPLKELLSFIPFALKKLPVCRVGQSHAEHELWYGFYLSFCEYKRKRVGELLMEEMEKVNQEIKGERYLEKVVGTFVFKVSQKVEVERESPDINPLSVELTWSARGGGGRDEGEGGSRAFLLLRHSLSLSLFILSRDADFSFPGLLLHLIHQPDRLAASFVPREVMKSMKGTEKDLIYSSWE